MSRLPVLAALTATVLVAALPSPASARPGPPLPSAPLSAPGDDVTSLPNVAAGEDGTTVAVWSLNLANDAVQAAVRPRESIAFAPGETLSEPGVNALSPQVAVGRDGTAAVAWRTNNATTTSIQVRVRPPGGTFGPVSTVSPAGQRVIDPRVAVGPDGRVTVLWGGDDTIFVASRPAGGSFSAPVTISTPGRLADNGELDVAANGIVSVAWTEDTGPAEPVFSRTIVAGQAPGTIQAVSAGDADVLDVALDVGVDGTTAITWSQADSFAFVPYATVRTAGSPFAAPARLASGDAGLLAVAVSPDGETTVAWRLEPTQELRWTTRPPGGLFFSEQPLAAGPADGLTLAAGPEGAVTAAFRRQDAALGDSIQMLSRRRGASTWEGSAAITSPTTEVSPGSAASAVGPDGAATLVFRATVSGQRGIRSVTTRSACFASDAIVGDDGPNTLTGDAGANVICGGGGDDAIDGGGGVDLLIGGPGNDTILDDVGNDTVDGGQGNDILGAGAGIDGYTGGAGRDRVSYATRTNSVNAVLGRAFSNGTTNENDAIAGDVEELNGGTSGDNLTGTDADNTLRGNGGPDTLRGLGGNDALRGGDGADQLEGSSGDDQLDGGNGDDFLLDGSGADTLLAGPGADRLFSSTDGAIDLLSCGTEIDTILNLGAGDRRNRDCELP